jgi:predicted membrane-bound spermidine synthase
MKKKTDNQRVIKPIEKELSLSFLYVLAFLEGALVIFSEMLGAKMLGAFFGNSLAVWTSVISTTIAFLTLGYYFGGLLSKRNDKTKILAFIFSLAGLFLIIMPSWSLTLFEKYNDATLISGAISSTVFLIGPSVLCLGMSSPIIIQLLSEQTNEAGKSAGHTYAISTLAGILSTLLIGFYLLPNWGVEMPIFIGTLCLLLVSFKIRFLYINIGSSIVFLLLLFTYFTKEDVSNKYFKKIYQSEGLMGQLKVYEQSFIDGDTKFRFLFINGIPQTIIYSHENLANSFWEYVHRISAVSSMKTNKKALLIGMGGGAIASELQKLNIDLDIVDIDKRMYQIAQEHFFFEPKKSTTFTVNDARHYIKTCKKKYDLIIIDIASGEVQPSNVFTKEGIAELKKIIQDDGIVLVQYQEKIDPTQLSGSQSIALTFQHNGFKTYRNFENIEVAGIILACSMNEIDFSKIDKEKLTANVAKQSWLDEFLKEPFQRITDTGKNSVLLVDDKPMLEHINAQTIEIWRTSMKNNYGLKILTQ